MAIVKYTRIGLRQLCDLLAEKMIRITASSCPRYAIIEKGGKQCYAHEGWTKMSRLLSAKLIKLSCYPGKWITTFRKMVHNFVVDRTLICSCSLVLSLLLVHRGFCQAATTNGRIDLQHDDSADVTCPQQCSCYETTADGPTVDCSGSQLASMPTAWPTQTQTM